MVAMSKEIILTHGGDWAGFAAQYGAEAPLLDCSANVSPLGLPAGVAKALAGCITRCSRYPCRQPQGAHIGRAVQQGRLGAVLGLEARPVTPVGQFDFLVHRHHLSTSQKPRRRARPTHRARNPAR